MDVGKRLLPQFVDGMAVSQPDRVAFIVGKSHELEDGLLDLTYKDLAHLINFAAWWIEKKWGRGSNYETLMFMGANDVRYFVFIAACNKVGYKVRQ